MFVVSFTNTFYRAYSVKDKGDNMSISNVSLSNPMARSQRQRVSFAQRQHAQITTPQFGMSGNGEPRESRGSGWSWMWLPALVATVMGFNTVRDNIRADEKVETSFNEACATAHENAEDGFVIQCKDGDILSIPAEDFFRFND